MMGKRICSPMYTMKPTSSAFPIILRDYLLGRNVILGLLFMMSLPSRGDTADGHMWQCLEQSPIQTDQTGAIDCGPILLTAGDLEFVTQTLDGVRTLTSRRQQMSDLRLNHAMAMAQVLEEALLLQTNKTLDGEGRRLLLWKYQMIFPYAEERLRSLRGLLHLRWNAQNRIDRRLYNATKTLETYGHRARDMLMEKRELMHELRQRQRDEYDAVSFVRSVHVGILDHVRFCRTLERQRQFHPACNAASYNITAHDVMTRSFHRQRLRAEKELKKAKTTLALVQRYVNIDESHRTRLDNITTTSYGLSGPKARLQTIQDQLQFCGKDVSQAQRQLIHPRTWLKDCKDADGSLDVSLTRFKDRALQLKNASYAVIATERNLVAMKPVMLNIKGSMSYINVVAEDVRKGLPYLHDMTSRIEAHAHILSEAAWRRINPIYLPLRRARPYEYVGKALLNVTSVAGNLTSVSSSTSDMLQEFESDMEQVIAQCDVMVANARYTTSEFEDGPELGRVIAWAGYQQNQMLSDWASKTRQHIRKGKSKLRRTHPQRRRKDESAREIGVKKNRRSDQTQDDTRRRQKQQPPRAYKTHKGSKMKLRSLKRRQRIQGDLEISPKTVTRKRGSLIKRKKHDRVGDPTLGDIRIRHKKQHALNATRGSLRRLRKRRPKKHLERKTGVDELMQNDWWWSKKDDDEEEETTVPPTKSPTTTSPSTTTTTTPPTTTTPTATTVKTTTAPISTTRVTTVADDETSQALKTTTEPDDAYEYTHDYEDKDEDFGDSYDDYYDDYDEVDLPGEDLISPTRRPASANGATTRAPEEEEEEGDEEEEVDDLYLYYDYDYDDDEDEETTTSTEPTTAAYFTTEVIDVETTYKKQDEGGKTVAETTRPPETEGTTETTVVTTTTEAVTTEEFDYYDYSWGPDEEDYEFPDEEGSGSEEEEVVTLAPTTTVPPISTTTQQPLSSTGEIVRKMREKLNAASTTSVALFFASKRLLHKRIAGSRPALSEAKNNLTTLEHGLIYVMSISNSTLRDPFPEARYDSLGMRVTIKKARRVIKQNKERKERVDRACAGVNETLRHLKEIPVMVATTLVPLTGGGVPGLNRQLRDFDVLSARLDATNERLNGMVDSIRSQIAYLKRQVADARKQVDYIQPSFHVQSPSNRTLRVPSLVRPSGGVDSIRLDVRTEAQAGVMLTITDARHFEDQMKAGVRTMRLTLSRGRPYLAWVENNITRRATTNRPINDGIWHQIRITRVGQRLELWELPSYIEETKYNATALLTLPFDTLLRPLPGYLIFGGSIVQRRKSRVAHLDACMRRVFINERMATWSSRSNRTVATCLAEEEMLEEMTSSAAGLPEGVIEPCIESYHQRMYLSKLINTTRNTLSFSFRTKVDRGMLLLYQAYPQDVFQLAVYQDSLLFEGTVNSSVFRHFCRGSTPSDNMWHHVILSTTNRTSGLYLDGRPCVRESSGLLRGAAHVPALSIFVNPTYIREEVIRLLPSKQLIPPLVGNMKQFLMNDQYLEFTRRTSACSNRR